MLFYLFIWRQSNALLFSDTTIKWLMDNLNWRTYCTRKSSLDGSRYYFAIYVGPLYSSFYKDIELKTIFYVMVMMFFPAALLWRVNHKYGLGLESSAIWPSSVSAFRSTSYFTFLKCYHCNVCFTLFANQWKLVKSQFILVTNLLPLMNCSSLTHHWFYVIETGRRSKHHS